MISSPDIMAAIAIGFIVIIIIITLIFEDIKEKRRVGRDRTSRMHPHIYDPPEK